MSRVTVTLEKAAYRPGEIVEGTVAWDTEGEDFESVDISLLWLTEGKGTEDTATAAQHHVPSPSPRGAERFALALPDYPWSVSGQLVSVVWAIEASLEPKGDVTLERLVSAPGGRALDIASLDPEADADARG